MQPDKELQKLTNRGWQQMRQNLDREMPEQPRRRRFGWWFWLLPTAFLLAGGGYFLSQIFSEKPEQKTSPVEPVASNRAAENFIDEKSIGSTDNFSNQKTENKPASTATSEPKFSQKTGATTKKTGEANSQPSNSKEKNELVSEKIETKNEANSSSKMFSAGFLLNDKTTTAEANSSSAAHPTIQKSSADWATAQLPTKPFSINFENDEPTPPAKQPLQPPIKSAKSGSKLSFGVTAGYLASNFWRPNGGFAGCVGDWKISPRWTVRAGLNFQKLTYKLSDGQVVASQVSAQVFRNLTGQEAFSSNSSTPNNLDSSTILAIPVNSLARVELPLQTQFFVNKKWYVSAGASIARTVGAGTNYEITGQQKNTAAPDADVQLDKHVRQNIANWSKFWTLGTGYQFSKNLEINLLLRQNWKKGQIATWSNHPDSFQDAGDLVYQKSASDESFDLRNIAYKRFRPELQAGLVWKL